MGGLSCLGNTLRGAVSKPIGSADSVCYDPESKMASPRSKSPHPVTPRKDEKEESFWDKIGTIGRKKKIKRFKRRAKMQLILPAVRWLPLSHLKNMHLRKMKRDPWSNLDRWKMLNSKL